MTHTVAAEERYFIYQSIFNSPQVTAKISHTYIPKKKTQHSIRKIQKKSTCTADQSSSCLPAELEVQKILLQIFLGNVDAQTQYHEYRAKTRSALCQK